MLARLSHKTMQAAYRSRKMSTSPVPTPATAASTPPTSAAITNPVANKAATSSSEPARKVAGGSTLVQRVSSFLIGAGLGFGAGFYYIFEEIDQSNKVFQKYLYRIEERVQILEGKK